MIQLKTITFAIYTGLVAVIIGLITFTLSWNFWDFSNGPFPGQFLLYPGKLTLVYIWHPLFTHEINLWPKLGLLLLGQFIVVASIAAVIISVIKRWISS